MADEPLSSPEGGIEFQWLYQAIQRLSGQMTLAIALLRTLIQQGVHMAGELDALTAQVAQNTTVEGSAITLLQNLSAMIASLKNSPAQLQALSDSLKTSATALADAITANTPAA